MPAPKCNKNIDLFNKYAADNQQARRCTMQASGQTATRCSDQSLVTYVEYVQNSHIHPSLLIHESCRIAAVYLQRFPGRPGAFYSPFCIRLFAFTMRLARTRTRPMTPRFI